MPPDSRRAAGTSRGWEKGSQGPAPPGNGRLSIQTSEGAAISKPDKDRAEPGLYLVATPLGNAADITLRALDLLRRVDLIACEDTRTSAKLLARHGIARPLTPYHEHNAPRARPALLRRLQQGEAVALVSDAGTPLISDPGYKLVREALGLGIEVTALPGPAAPIVALTLSGLPTDRFYFAGFLPARRFARRRELAKLAAIDATLVAFESPRRLARTLADMADVLGHRQAAVARELTKRFEEVRRGPLEALAKHYASAGPPKGEIVIVAGPPERDEAVPALGEKEIDAKLREAMSSMRVKDAAAAVAAATGLPRRALYSRALKLAEKGAGMKQP